MKELIAICLFIVMTFTINAQEKIKLETFEENGKIGILNNKGKKITTAKYDKYIIIDDEEYSFIATFYEGLCSVFINNKMGFIDLNGKEVTPIEFSYVRDFTVDGIAAVQKDGKWGFINRKGKQIVPLVYDMVLNFKNGKAIVILDKKINFIDTKGEKISNLNYSLYNKYKEGSLTIINNDIRQFGFMGTGGILPNFYDKIAFFENADYILVKLNKKVGIINLNAKEIIPPIYDEFGSFDGKYFYLWKNHKEGIIDNEGRIISPFVYGSIRPFSEGLSLVKLDLVFVPNKNKNEDERYGYIDENGKEVIPRIYDNAWDFNNGKAKVNIANREFYIDKSGKEIK
jgi:hypothetical protein